MDEQLPVERSVPRHRPRRTQVERSATTRAALLTAALECLVALGYAKTTTGRVCERAGVSRGALLHHFQTRGALVADALGELSTRREDEFRRSVNDLPDGEERVERSLDLLWSWFNGPLFLASVELGTAARTDPELRKSLVPVERDLNRRTLLRCREMFATSGEDASMDPLIQMTLAMVRGLALLPVLQPGTRKATKQWHFARSTLAALIREAHDASAAA
jgi:AcrR family transcriptional regulator